MLDPGRATGSKASRELLIVFGHILIERIVRGLSPISGEQSVEALRGHGLQRQGGAHLLREGHQGLHLQRRLRLLQAEGKDGQLVVFGAEVDKSIICAFVLEAFPV